MSGSPTELAIAGLKKRLDNIDGGRDPRAGRLAVAEEKIARLERQRSRLARTVMILSVAVLLLTGILVAVLLQRGAARDYYNGQLHKLACTAVERHPSADDPTIRDLRDHYHCPPYQAPAPPKKSNPKAGRPAVPGTSPTPAPRSTITVIPRPSTPRPSASPSPGLSSTPHRPSPTSAPSPTPTRISTPTAPRSTPNPIGRLICRVLGIVVPCRTENP